MQVRFVALAMIRLSKWQVLPEPTPSATFLEPEAALTYKQSLRRTRSHNTFCREILHANTHFGKLQQEAHNEEAELWERFVDGDWTAILHMDCPLEVELMVQECRSSFRLMGTIQPRVDGTHST